MAKRSGQRRENKERERRGACEFDGCSAKNRHTYIHTNKSRVQTITPVGSGDEKMAYHDTHLQPYSQPSDRFTGVSECRCEVDKGSRIGTSAAGSKKAREVAWIDKSGTSSNLPI